MFLVCRGGSNGGSRWDPQTMEPPLSLLPPFFMRKEEKGERNEEEEKKISFPLIYSWIRHYLYGTGA